jgi:NADH-quinone oxidoreductase subunit J
LPENAFISPALLYAACAIGAVGVVLAMPRKKVAPYVIGAAVGAIAFAVLMIALAKAAGGQGLPGGLFYVFSLIALGSSLRVITHPRPIYAALYFILTIVASTGLFVLLSAEFMAFALIIIYAGAILITYMFVIMLASEGATEAATEGATEYDRVSREPLVATVAGFVLLAALCMMLGGGGAGGGVKDLAVQNSTGDSKIVYLNHRIEDSLRRAGLMSSDETLAEIGSDAEKMYTVGHVINVKKAGESKTRAIPQEQWPADLRLTNTEGIGFELMESNPGAIEIAGIVLLMAMLGSVVLARKKVEMDDQAKAAAAERAHQGTDGELGIEGTFVQPAVGGNQ